MKPHLFIFFMLMSASIFAQNVSGTIVGDDKKKLEGVYILNLKTNSHAHTNESGLFNINQTNTGDTLKIGLMGFKSQLFVVKDGQKPINILLDKMVFELAEITVNASPKSANIISDIDIKLNPVNSSQEILRKVPGLFIGQHAGGGKAEQMFLRGFDLDHGTDINISVACLSIWFRTHTGKAMPICTF